MRLATLKLDRFGARSQFHLSELAPQLNVIYGPNGSGKTTLIQFVRWMLFGQRDQESARYLNTGDVPAGGEIIFDDARGRRTLRRATDRGATLDGGAVASPLEHGTSGAGYYGPTGFRPTALGPDSSYRTSVADAYGSDIYGTDPYGTDRDRSRVGQRYAASSYTGQGLHLGLSAAEFDRFFIINFDRARDSAGLLRAAQTHGLQLQHDQAQLDRIEQLQREIAARRSELDRYGYVSGTAESLRQRQADLRRQIQELREAQRRRQAELAEQRQQLQAAVDQQQAVVGRLRDEWQQADSAWQARRAQLEQEYRQWMEAREAAIARRNQQLRDLDAQLVRWREVLTDVRRRLEQFRGVTTELHDVAISPVEAADTEHFMRTLGSRVRDLEQDLFAVYRPERWHEPSHVGSVSIDPRNIDRTSIDRTSDISRWMGTALNTVQSDVARLYQSMQQQQRAHDARQHQAELQQLRRVERELTELVDELDRQRQHLQAAPMAWPGDETWASLPHVSYADGRYVDRTYGDTRYVDGRYVGESRRDAGYADPNVASYGNYGWDSRPDGRTRDAGYWPVGTSEYVPGDYRSTSRVDDGRYAVDGYRDTHDVPYDAHGVARSHGDWDGAWETLARNDLRYRQLAEVRDQAAERLRSAEHELAQRQARLDDLLRQAAHLDEARVDELQRAIADAEEQMRRLEQRGALQRQIEALEAELQRLRGDLGHSQIVTQAAATLRRLTDGEFHQLRLNAGRCQVVRARDGRVYDDTQLSRGVQDQLYLALGLAIAAAFRQRNVGCPLILNDVFGNLDQSGARALADVLLDFASHGQQVLVFTRHAHIRELFEPSRARVIHLVDASQTRPRELYRPAPPPVAPVYQAPVVEPAPPVLPDQTYRWVAQWQPPTSEPLGTYSTHRASTAVMDVAPVAEMPEVELPPVTLPPLDQTMVAPAPARTVARTVRKEVASPPPTVKTRSNLTLNTTLAKVPTIGEELVSYLSTLNVFTIEDLLALDPTEAESRLGQHGITAEIVQRRQREVLMLLYLAVPPLEAQLLVACGVPDPDRLSRADESVLLKRIQTILERPQAAQRFGAASLYTVDRVQGWIEAARRSEYRGRSRRSPLDGGRASSRSRGKRRSGLHSDQAAAAERAAAAQPGTVRLAASSTADLRFYLELNDPVVDAPSIGPKMAERLNRLDVYTVTQLLEADATWIADQLDDRRISAETVTDWQLQAQLVCRIPNLRGHDAQILVACGIQEPATLASLQPSSLLQRVAQFVDTKEGQRMLRNSKRPDLAEVTAWIEWSESARQLRAA